MKKQINIFAEVLENEALEQFYRAMALPQNVAGALMPDAHAGYTLPVGAVVKSEKWVFPSYVGFDIGCTDEDTEFLSKNGWKKISDYEEGDEVLAYDPVRNVSRFEKPIRYQLKLPRSRAGAFKKKSEREHRF